MVVRAGGPGRLPKHTSEMRTLHGSERQEEHRAGDSEFRRVLSGPLSSRAGMFLIKPRNMNAELPPMVQSRSPNVPDRELYFLTRWTLRLSSGAWLRNPNAVRQGRHVHAFFYLRACAVLSLCCSAHTWSTPAESPLLTDSRGQNDPSDFSTRNRI